MFDGIGIGGDGSGESPLDGYSLGELRHIFEVWLQLSENIGAHSMVVLADPTHRCDMEEVFESDEWRDSTLTPDELKAYLAFESSAIAAFSFIRHALRLSGEAVQEFSDFVGDELYEFDDIPA